LKERLAQSQISEMRKLARDGYSIRSISEKFQVGKSTVYYHVKNYCHKMTTFDITLLEECEKGYIIGLFLGDGSFNKGSKEPRFFVRFALDAKRDREITSKIAQIIRKAGKRISLITWKSNIIAKICSKELVAYIQNYVEYKQGEKKLLDNKNWSTNFKYGFVAGIIDSDGHVHAHLGTEVKTVSSNNFESVSSILEDLEISATTRVRAAPDNSYSKKPRYIIYIPSSEMKRIKGCIPSAKVARYL
jgi:DNA-binding transcriptional regulator WhiA